MAPIIINENSVNGELINKLAHHPLQSYEWGVAREKMGIEVVRIQDKNNS